MTTRRPSSPDLLCNMPSPPVAACYVRISGGAQRFSYAHTRKDALALEYAQFEAIARRDGWVLPEGPSHRFGDVASSSRDAYLADLTRLLELAECDACSFTRVYVATFDRFSRKQTLLNSMLTRLKSRGIGVRTGRLDEIEW